MECMCSIGLHSVRQLILVQDRHKEEMLGRMLLEEGSKGLDLITPWQADGERAERVLVWTMDMRMRAGKVAMKIRKLKEKLTIGKREKESVVLILNEYKVTQMEIMQKENRLKAWLWCCNSWR